MKNDIELIAENNDEESNFERFTANLEGLQAFLQQKKNYDTNPYSKETQYASWYGWLEGWIDAHDENEYDPHDYDDWEEEA
jgi:ribosome modulation factor